MKNKEWKGPPSAHQWVTYSNPRNGKVKVQACGSCGALLNSILAATPCAGAQAENKITSLGWLPVGDTHKDLNEEIEQDANLR